MGKSIKRHNRTRPNQLAKPNAERCKSNMLLRSHLRLVEMAHMGRPGLGLAVKGRWKLLRSNRTPGLQQYPRVWHLRRDQAETSNARLRKSHHKDRTRPNIRPNDRQPEARCLVHGCLLMETPMANLPLPLQKNKLKAAFRSRDLLNTTSLPLFPQKRADAETDAPIWHLRSTIHRPLVSLIL
jgi:hypothetical protein